MKRVNLYCTMVTGNVHVKIFQKVYHCKLEQFKLKFLLATGGRCGRCKLQNVKVMNKGVNWMSGDNVYWKHEVQRFENLKIVLQGNAEFEATDVVLQVELFF